MIISICTLLDGHLTATWELDVKNLHRREGQAIHGLTERSRDTRIVGRFLRFRFPLVRFEWHIETPYSELKKINLNTKANIDVMWKAWARSGASSGAIHQSPQIHIDI